jgi:AraC-like DNA-binding protein
VVAPNPDLISVRLFKPFIRLLVERAVPLLPLIEGLDLRPEVFLDPDARVAWDTMLVISDRALRATGDPALGARAAEYIHHGDFDALELVARASGTRRGALAAVVRYAQLLGTVTITHTVEGSSEAWALALPPPNPRFAVEYVLGILVVVGRSLAAGDENPDEVQLAFPQPEDSAVYERIYGCPVRWRHHRNALIVSTQRLNRKIAHITPSLALAMQQHAEKLLADLPIASTHSTRVREQIVAALQEGSVSPAEVCRRLKVSERTLRRRLQDEGRTFSDLLSEVRRDLAHRYLEDPNRSVTEVAFLLGFADASAFQRAFRQWYGMPPSEYRKTMRERGSPG